MPWSPVTLGDSPMADVVAPGAPAFLSFNQLDNKFVEANLILPAVDSDGTELTGLTVLAIATAPQLDGVNPFGGLGWLEVTALPGAVVVSTPVTPGDAGATKTIKLPVVALGGVQAFAAACSDTPV